MDENTNDLKTVSKLLFLEKCLNDGWTIYKKNDNYHLIKKKDGKNKKFNLNEYINNILININ